MKLRFAEVLLETHITAFNPHIPVKLVPLYFISVLQMRKLRVREARRSAQDHIARK